MSTTNRIILSGTVYKAVANKEAVIDGCDLCDLKDRCNGTTCVPCSLFVDEIGPCHFEEKEDD